MNKLENPGSPPLQQAEGSSLPGPSTLRRGLKVLDALRDAGELGLHVTEVASATGIQRSTVYRFLDVLIETGYAVRDENTKRYHIAGEARQTIDPHALAVTRFAPALRRISDITGDSAFLICRAGNDSLCLHREVGHYPVQVLAVTIGHRQPMGVGAAGLAFLSALPLEEALAMIEHNKLALRAYGGMTAPHMRRLMQNTRDRGWSVVGNAAVPGVVGVGAALVDARGQPLLAISVSSTVTRMPPARQHEIAGIIRTELKAYAP